MLGTQVTLRRSKVYCRCASQGKEKNTLSHDLDMALVMRDLRPLSLGAGDQAGKEHKMRTS
jgi:hypothetical protein